MFAYCNNNPANSLDSAGTMAQKHAFDSDRSIGCRRYEEFASTIDAYSASGLTLYPTAESAITAWRNVYLPLSEEYEYGTYLYSVETVNGTYFYTAQTFKGTKAGRVMSPNVLVPVLLLHTIFRHDDSNLVGLIHTHPSPGQDYHNDFPSNDAGIYGGDRIVYALLGYSELYVIPYQRCTNTPIIVKYTDQTTWCDYFIPD